MKIRAAFAFAVTLIVGACAGWFSNAYWENETRKVQSTMALISANEASQNGDLDKAIKYATYALFLDNESPLADIQIKEFTKRAADIAASKCKDEAAKKK